jgi:hypothetical protein
MYFPTRHCVGSAEDIVNVVLDDGSIVHFCNRFKYLGSIFILDLAPALLQALPYAILCASIMYPTLGSIFPNKDELASNLLDFFQGFRIVDDTSFQMCSPASVFSGIDEQEQVCNCLYILYIYICTVGNLATGLQSGEMRRAIHALGCNLALSSTLISSPVSSPKFVRWGSTPIYHQHMLDMLAYFKIKLPKFSGTNTDFHCASL